MQRRRKRQREFQDERLYRRGRKIWARVQDVHGYIQRVSTGCTLEAAATDWANEWERKAASPSYRRQAETTLADAIADWRTHFKRRKVSEATEQIAEQKLGHFVRLWGEDWPLLRVENDLVLQYIDQRESEDVKPLTIKRELNHLRRVLAHARWRGTFPRAPEEVIPPEYSGQYTPKKRTLTPEEIVKLLSQLAPHRGAHVAYILATGARWSESLKAERGDFKRDTLLVWVRGTKTPRAEDMVPITGVTWDLLVYALQHAPSDKPLFAPWGKYWRDIKAACARAEIDPCSPNDLRRTFGTMHRRALLAAGHSKESAAEQVAILLRHSTDKLAQTTYARAGGADIAATLQAISPVPGLYAETTSTSQNRPNGEEEPCTEQQENRAPPAVIETATFGLGSLRPAGASERRSTGIKRGLQGRSKH